MMEAAVEDFGYNTRGEQVSAPGRTVEYTSFGLPSSITANGGKTTFKYDAENARVMKIGPDGSTLYAGGLYERRTTTSGTTHVFYVIAGGQVLGQLESSGTGTEDLRYYHVDQLGSTTQTIDASGNVTFVRRDPWGQMVAKSGDTVRIGFTGQEDDVEFGLINMGGRIYDPRTTRFLTPDPIGRALGSAAGNRYAYVLNNPTNLVDPTGFMEEMEADAFGPGSGSEFGLTPEYSKMLTRSEDGLPTNNTHLSDGLYAQPGGQVPPPSDPPPPAPPAGPGAIDQTGSLAGVAQTGNAPRQHFTMPSRGAEPGTMFAKGPGGLDTPTDPKHVFNAGLPIYDKALKVLERSRNKTTHKPTKIAQILKELNHPPAPFGPWGNFFTAIRTWNGLYSRAFPPHKVGENANALIGIPMLSYSDGSIGRTDTMIVHELAHLSGLLTSSSQLSEEDAIDIENDYRESQGYEPTHYGR
jgi:RHS repeat-associated protein